MKTMLAAVVMTFALGFSTAAAFYAVGGRLALMGPYVLVREWPAIYFLVAVFAVAVGLVLGAVELSLSGRRLVAVIVGAWVGEYLVLASGVLSNELAIWYSPLNGVGIWIAATAGPMQPVAAWLGAVLGRRFRRRRE